MEELTKLIEHLQQEKPSRDLSLSLLRISDDSINLGLYQFFSILKLSLQQQQQSVDGKDYTKLGFQFWSQSQIQSLASLSISFLHSTKLLSLEHVEPVIVGIVEESLEFAASCLEKSSFDGDDFSSQNIMVQLLEAGLCDGMDKEYEPPPASSASSIAELLPASSVECGNFKLDFPAKCDLPGTSCSEVEKPVDQLIFTLASECMQPYSNISQFSGPSFYRDFNKLVSLFRHWAVVHVGCIPRLLLLCKELMVPNMFDDKTNGNFRKRLSLSSRILKLLVNLAINIPYVKCDSSLLQAVASCAEVMSSLFKIELEFVNGAVSVETSFENLALSLLEDFVCLVQAIFGSSSSIFQNIQACLVASMLDHLDCVLWRYNRSAANVRAPLIYFPRSVLFLLKLIEDVKKQRHCSLDRTEFNFENIGKGDMTRNSSPDFPHFEEAFLLKKHSVEELLNVIFPSSKQWVDNLMHLLFFLHLEGIKLRPKLERSHSTGVKAGCSSEVENAISHEDEALFGDLFSEGGRSMGSADGYDQPQVAVNPVSSYCNLPLQAAAELLCFLKLCVFSPDWHLPVYEDGCKKLTVNHINILLSILNCHGCSCEERSSNGNAASLEPRVGHVHGLCFELLQNFMTSNALSSSLEEYLVEEILKVENGFFVYSDRILILLAQILICRVGSAGSRLRNKVYKGYVDFIFHKVEAVCSKCPSLNELLDSLPSIFYIEILIMAFHLSSVEEKAMLASLVFSSLRTLDTPTAGCSSTQLSCWALLISRLILVLRHMAYYPADCPPELLLDLRFKLREAPAFGSHSLNNAYGNLFSWAAIAVEHVVGTLSKEDPFNNLLPQLIDVAAAPTSVYKENPATPCSFLCWDDIWVTFSGILDLWKGKNATSVEDLVIERYIFALCWDIPTMCSSLKLQHLIGGDLEKLKFDIVNFFNFSHSLLEHSSVIDVEKFQDLLLGILHQLAAVQLVGGGIDVFGWDFLSSGMWCSLILSLLNTGIWGLCRKNALPGAAPVWTKKNFTDDEFLTLAEGLTSNLLDANCVGLLLKTLSSLSRGYLQAYQKVFLATLLDGEHSARGFSPLLLLKHTGFDKGMQDEILEKCGSNLYQLESALGLLPKLDQILDERAPRILSKVFWEFMLHGLPSNLHNSSGALVSCILSIRLIVNVLDGLIRILSEKGLLCMETEVLHQLLDAVMIVKSDRIFEGLHEKCGAIYQSLSAHLGGLDYNEIFLLKQMEWFLRNIKAGEVSDSTFESMVTKTIDTIESLRKDPSKSAIFKFYVGVKGESDHVKELCGLQHGNLLVLIDSLDNCYSETVNVKVLNFFVDLLSGEPCTDLNEKIQQKILTMDLMCLSKWLEKRLLGCIVEASDGVGCEKGSSSSLRESTMNFILCLVSSFQEIQSKELQDHLFEALLASLDSAFTRFDIHTSKAYFYSLIQLARAESSVNPLLEKTLNLMEKLVGDEHLLQGLKFLFGFFGTVLSDCVSSKTTLNKISERSLSSSNLGMGAVASRPPGSKKSSETMVLSASQGGPAVDCDATSVDEDEDDGTSDGEVASLDKDEEDDSNSERALASKVCTFTSSGSNFMEQHWYFCYTCDLTVSKGCCSVCAKVCHRGHRVVYSRSSRFFCDCGAGGVRGSSCQCLKPRKFAGSNSGSASSVSNFQPFLPLTEDGDQFLDSDSDLDEDTSIDIDNSVKLSIPRDVQDRIPTFLEELDIEGRILGLCSSLLPSVSGRRDSNLFKDKKVILGEDKVLLYGVELLQLKKAYKSGSLDLKVKAEYSNTKELKSHLASGSLVKSLLSVSTRGRLAVGEGDKVSVFDVGQLIGQATIAPVTADKTNVKPLSKNVVRFEIVHLVFNPAVESYLAVAGFEDCQVLTIGPRGEVTDRLAIELALQGAYIRQVEWLPGSHVHLMVVTNMFVKIYDLSQDNISPLHYFTLPDDMIIDATLFVAPQGRLFLIVLSECGSLFKLELSMEGNVGAKSLNEIIRIQDRDIQAKGLSLCFSSTYKLLFVSYQDGTTLIGRLNSTATALTEISAVYEDEQDGKLRSAGLHRWKELLSGSGLFACSSSVKSNAALAVCMGAQELFAQNLRHAVGSSSPLVGMTAYKPLSKDKIHCLVLHDDGSLQIYSHVPAGSDTGANGTADKVKKLGSRILNKAYAGANPEFPLDFFEKTICITADVKLGGDAIRNGDSEGTKQSLASEDGFLESPSPAGFKINVTNSNPDIVMVGFRLHVGSTSATHIPSDITIFQRVIKLDEGMRSWYDVPFTVAESLLADEEFTISVGPTFNGSALPRIDSLEVYGRAKDEFGWKEKMDAVLDMESRVLGSNSLATGSRKKSRSVQVAPIQEQVIADGLKVLSRFYSAFKSEGYPRVEDVKVELSKLKSRQLLEIIFESDREPLLQAAACRVLQAIFPKKDAYYQVKDTMRLLGVVKSTSVISSRLGVGGSTTAWIIEEFTAQMRAVSKIALHRRANLATFLEINGPEVVDGLMQVLWGILEIEQPDTQTMSNIVMSSVELIYCYAECSALNGKEAAHSVAPAVVLLNKLLFSANQSVQTSSSLAISSRLLQVPFPKQTMLATDDVAENSASANVLADVVNAAGGNAQVMIEEDSITSSVQYCCDGCSTVPILRRRWHCTVCPDFDLCEACYEVLDADRLPPPHSRDHPMSAIPIEVETLGGDGNDIQFSTDDLSDSSLLPVPTDVRAQNSTPSIHVLEPNEPEEFSASVMDPVSISESKRAVNSMLLSELLDQLKGWMEKTSGVRAIPVMQLFYRLSSTVGGPFIDSSKPEGLNLEKLINWFLDEINLNKPFIAKTRSTFGEVAILVLMFFTLMLRNWHQPGSDNSVPKSSGTAEAQDKSVVHIPSTVSVASPTLDDQEKNDFASQLVRACGSLRQQPFVNYLMDILQQLMQVFKSPAANIDTAHGLNPCSGCGALLTVRRELPAGNFAPFFSDSYAKAHRSDIFMDYHRLLLENVFRLVYTLVRPEKQDKAGEKDKVYRVSSGRDLKLDGYQDVLCSYINNPHTTFVRRYARRLFLHLCGSKTHYYSVRDSWQFSTEVKRLYKHVNKSGGFQNSVPYERSVKIVKSLSTIAEVAAARPRNWQKYCLRHGDVLPFLMNGVFHFGEESVIQTLKLLSLAFYSGKDMSALSTKTEAGDMGTGSTKSGSQSGESKKKKKGEDGTESGLEKSCLDMEPVVNIFTDKDGTVLRHFIDCFLLEWNSSSVRAEAKSVIYGVWHHAKQLFRETMLTALLHKMKNLPMCGQNIIEYTELVTWLLGKVPDIVSKQQSSELVDRCLTATVVRNIFDTLHLQNELLANHPNSRIYNTLSSLVEFDGYYLESEPCVACSSPEVPYSRMKLESLKSETKFTDNRITVKCTGSYTIQTVTMNVHDARKSKSVKVLNLYYNNRPVADLSELKNNWSLWKRAKSCHLAFNQTELKVEFPIPITACNFMIELDSFYENLQALSLEPLQCPRCTRPVIDRHGICSNCHENAYQCRQCRNINYENLDSFLCNECGYSKYGRFEFNFMAKPSFTFDNMENDEDMKRGLVAIEFESENAHRRYQQLLGFKKPLLKIVSSIGENEMDSQQKDSVQQMMVSLPGPSCKINRKIALLGVLYGEKCKAAFDSVSKSVQTLQGLRRVLMSYLHQKHSDGAGASSRLIVSRSPNSCYGCAMTFVTQCLDILQVLSKHPNSKKLLVSAGILSELFENNIHQGPKAARVQARAVLCAFSEGNVNAVTELNNLIQKKVMYCLEHHRSMDIALATREELLLLSEICSLTDEYWESRLRVVFQLLFSSIKLGAKHPAISEHVILPCLRIISQACTPPKPDAAEKDHGLGKSSPLSQVKDQSNSNPSGSLGSLVSGAKTASDASEKSWDGSGKTQDIQLLSYSEWEKGASYLDFVRRQYKVSQAIKGTGQKSRPQRTEYLVLKYALKWKRRASKSPKSEFSAFELGSWVTELVLSACSQSIRSEMCMLISLLCSQSSARRFRLLNLLMGLLPATLSAGESAAEYFDLLFKMIDSEDARLFLTVGGCLSTICKLITQEVSNIESLERSLHIDISQGFILHKLIELLGKFLDVSNIRSRFMRENLLSQILEALIVIRGLIVQKTKLIGDCNRLLKDILDSLLLESSENKRQFIRACIHGLQIHGEEKKGRTSMFILEQLCNLICPSKPESLYLLVLNKAHTQEEFIRGSMTKNPYSSAEIGPLMRDVKNKICHQLDLLGLLEDDYGMELLVAGNIISLDLSIAQVYEQVWKKSSSQASNITGTTLLSSNAVTSSRDCPPMTVTYRLQGLDGEATEPMIKELEEDREESQDPEVEFAIAGAVREHGGLEIILDMIKRLREDLRSNQEQLVAVLNLLMHCCKIRENRRALLRLGALSLLLETARRAFSVDAMEPAEGILLIVESLTLEANESDNINIAQSVLTVTSEETGAGEQAKKIVLMFLERLSHPSGLKKSNKQQRNTEMVARILPYLTYGEPAAMEALIQHFNPYLQDWNEFDQLQKQQEDNPKDENIALQAAKQRFALENFVRVSESLKTSSCGERLKDIILEKGITGVAVKHLKETFAVAGQAGFKSTSEWALGLKLPSIPLILSMLRGLSMGHLPTQRCIDEGGILPLLHALEGVPGENEIGARAENLLDTLANKEGNEDGFLGEKIRKLRHATRDEMRRRALRKREELLQGLGMRQELNSDGGERIIVARPNLEGLEDVEEEEDGLACMVCREGYSLRPTDLLGVYSYSKRVNLGMATTGSGRGECVYTTVSHFNIIHFQCHQEAKRADAALKNPKKEWEGATLRNNETLCNSLFPVRGPSVPMMQYIRYVDQYWDNLNALGRTDGSRLRLLTYDIVLMLARFATGASFSADSKGGGRESNSKFLPFMIQMARHLLDQGSPTQRRTMAKNISTYLASSVSESKSSSPGVQPSVGTEETVQFMMVHSLLSESYESWLQHRRSFLQRGIYHAYMQHTHGRQTSRGSSVPTTPSKSEAGSSSRSPGSEIGSADDLLSIVQPMLVYTGLIEQLQQFFKVRKPSSIASAKSEGSSTGLGGEDEGGSLEAWEMVMKEKLLNVKEMVGFSKELLSWLEDMTSASELQEAFDIIGALPDVLSGGFSRCEDFVHAAIGAGKS